VSKSEQYVYLYTYKARNLLLSTWYIAAVLFLKMATKSISQIDHLQSDIEIRSGCVSYISRVKEAISKICNSQ